MTDSELVTAADMQLMQDLAQRVAAVRPDLISADASYGELAWVWGKDYATQHTAWRRRFWHSGGDLVAWGWVTLPRQARRGDGSIRTFAEASLAYQIHPDHLDLIDDVIDWYDGVAAGLDRLAFPTNAEEYALKRWAAHGYEPDTDALSDTGDWTQFNRRDLADIEDPVLPPGYRLRTAAEVGPAAAVQAHLDAWGPTTTYSAQAYEDVRNTAAYRDDLHFLVEAPDGAMAASTIMWFDPANKSVEFEPVGTHPAHRRKGLAGTMILHAMHQARDAGATHATVVCLGAPGHPAARGLYYSLGFREISRDAPVIKPKSAP